MSYVTILWSATAAFALLLGIVHAFVWMLDRRARPNLAFALLALSLVAVAATELGMMQSQTPEAWAAWVRWCHLPLFFLIVGTVVFVHLYLGTGRPWLIGAIVVVRGVILVRNFTTYPNFNFERIASIDRISFLGEHVSVVGEAVPSSWQWLATAAGLLFLVFIVDASVALWRARGPDARRKTLLIGGGVLVFVLLALVCTQLVIWGLLELPMLITPPFLIPLGAMAYELSRDMLRSASLARELGESERRLSLAASSAGLGLCAWNGGNRIWATDRARAMFGCAADDNIDIERVIPLVHRDDLPGLRAAMQQAVSTGGEFVAEFRVEPPGRPQRWLSARGSAESTARGRPPAMRGVLRDVTDQRRAAAESEQLRRELAHAGRVTMLGKLASALAHELSQPLGAILRNAEAAEILLQTPSPDFDELRAIMADIHRDDRRAGEVIDRLRSLLKRREMDFQSVAVESLVRDVGALVRPDAAARRVILDCTADADLPPISGDKVHLSQVLINLIINAFDATAEATRSRRVSVEARKGPSQSVEVAVTDSGSGIPPERIEQIFEPFFTTKPDGLGLGLSVSRTIIEAHGGRLWAENAIDGGASFRFSVPAAQGDIA